MISVCYPSEREMSGNWRWDFVCVCVCVLYSIWDRSDSSNHGVHKTNPVSIKCFFPQYDVLKRGTAHVKQRVQQIQTALLELHTHTHTHTHTETL